MCNFVCFCCCRLFLNVKRLKRCVVNVFVSNIVVEGTTPIIMDEHSIELNRLFDDFNSMSGGDVSCIEMSNNDDCVEPEIKKNTKKFHYENVNFCYILLLVNL